MTVATQAVVADTQIVVWYVLEPSRLSDAARDALEGAVGAQEPIRVCAWSIVEIIYAAEKPSNPITEDDRDAILGVLTDPESPFEVVPVDAAIATKLQDVPRSENADPGDRIIIATAEVLGLPLVSSDPRFSAMTATRVVWR